MFEARTAEILAPGFETEMDRRLRLAVEELTSWRVFDTWKKRWCPTPPTDKQAAKDRAVVLNASAGVRGSGQGCTRYEARRFDAESA